MAEIGVGQVPLIDRGFLPQDRREQTPCGPRGSAEIRRRHDYAGQAALALPPNVLAASSVLTGEAGFPPFARSGVESEPHYSGCYADDCGPKEWSRTESLLLPSLSIEALTDQTVGREGGWAGLRILRRRQGL